MKPKPVKEKDIERAMLAYEPGMNKVLDVARRIVAEQPYTEAGYAAQRIAEAALNVHVGLNGLRAMTAAPGIGRGMDGGGE